MKQLIDVIASSFLFCLILASALTGCNSQERSSRAQLTSQWMAPNNKLKVLSTTAMIHDLVQKVGGEHVDGLTLIIGELDPHSYQLVKGDDEKLVFADLIFYNGLGLEHGPSLRSFLEHHEKAIALGDKIYHDDASLMIKDQGQLDPHIWMDMSLWTKAVPHIVSTLSQKDPAHAKDYLANGKQLMNTLMQEHEQIKNTLHQVPPLKRYLVTSHDAFNYFTRAYLAQDGEEQTLWQERFAAPEGLAPDSQLSATDIQKIIAHLKKYKVQVIFPESNISRDSIRKIVQAAKEIGLNVSIATEPLYADAMGKPGSATDTYVKMMRHNAATIAAYLQKNGNN